MKALQLTHNVTQVTYCDSRLTSAGTCIVVQLRKWLWLSHSIHGFRSWQLTLTHTYTYCVTWHHSVADTSWATKQNIPSHWGSRQL